MAVVITLMRMESGCPTISSIVEAADGDLEF